MAKIKRTMTVSLEEFGKKAGEYALDEFEYNGLTIRQWADKIKFLLKLERFYDIYCSDYKPDWNSSENKYLILYSHTTNRYVVGNAVCIEPSLPCFPTQEIAQKVCDVLNKEL